MKKVHNTVADEDEKWAPFFEKMKKKGEWADGPVLPVAARFFNMNINIISPKCKESNPWYANDGGEGAGKKPSLFLANVVNLHFQSLLPTNEAFQFEIWEDEQPLNISTPKVESGLKKPILNAPDTTPKTSTQRVENGVKKQVESDIQVAVRRHNSLLGRLVRLECPPDVVSTVPA